MHIVRNHLKYICAVLCEFSLGNEQERREKIIEKIYWDNKRNERETVGINKDANALIKGLKGYL